MNKKLFPYFFTALFFIFFLPKISLADIVYFKNGFKTEGEVIKTEEGVWVNGGLFSENEIERIEEAPVKNKNAEGKSWFENVMAPFSKKEEKPKSTTYTDRDPNAAHNQQQKNQQAAKDSGGLLKQLLPGNMGSSMDLVGHSSQTYGNAMHGQMNALQHAQQLQQEAYQKQLMMQKEMMMMESGEYPQGALPPQVPLQPMAYPEVPNPAELYDPGSSSGGKQSGSSSNSSYRSKSRSKSPYSKGIKFNPDGSANWE